MAEIEMDENRTEWIRRVAELAAYALGMAGCVFVTVAGVWWLYEMYQKGITYNELASVGIVLVSIAFSLWLISRDPDHATENALFGGRDD